METNRIFSKGWWILPAFLLILISVRFNFTLDQYVGRLLVGPSDDSPGDDRPFYFLRGDMVEGLCAGAAVLLSLLLVTLTWKKYRQQSFMALWMAWIWCMPAVVKAVIIYVRCPNLMDVNNAQSAWATHHDYLYDPILIAAFWVTLLSGIALARVGNRRYGSNHLDTNGVIAANAT